MEYNRHEFDPNLIEDIALAEYEIGFDARVFGEPYQPDASPDWLRGWQAAAGDNAGDDE
jgi:hypothetical protein